MNPKLMLVAAILLSAVLLVGCGIGGYKMSQAAKDELATTLTDKTPDNSVLIYEDCKTLVPGSQEESECFLRIAVSESSIEPCYDIDKNLYPDLKIRCYGEVAGKKGNPNVCDSMMQTEGYAADAYKKCLQYMTMRRRNIQSQDQEPADDEFFDPDAGLEPLR
ncbi:hypothetical protein JW711_02340 [Candidatus Woesearchaeota archaeon]|nr:hypothetical protein [Candidatus Woesearchaeota archaeon]